MLYYTYTKYPFSLEVRCRVSYHLSHEGASHGVSYEGAGYHITLAMREPSMESALMVQGIISP